MSLYTQTDPVNSDTDGDGLDDGVENSLGTGIREDDSDYDGLNDGDEINIYKNINILFFY